MPFVRGCGPAYGYGNNFSGSLSSTDMAARILLQNPSNQLRASFQQVGKSVKE